MVLIILVLGLLFFISAPPVTAQIKLSDRKSIGYKESKKNKNKKKRQRTKKYRKSARQNQTPGDIEVVPRVLDDQMRPMQGNAEANPSRSASRSQRKQRSNYAKKASEATRQGLLAGKSYKARQRKIRKQSAKLARNQGDIQVIPYAQQMREGGFMVTPNVEPNPSRANQQIRNKQLAQYASKSEEAQMQGMLTGPTKSRNNRINRKQSRTVGLDQGNLPFGRNLIPAWQREGGPHEPKGNKDASPPRFR